MALEHAGEQPPEDEPGSDAMSWKTGEEPGDEPGSDAISWDELLAPLDGPE